MKKNNFFDINLSSVDSVGSIMLVDGTNLFIRSFSSYPTMNDNGVHIGGFFGFFDTLVRFVSKYNVKQLCICFDGDNSSSRRKKLYSGYKANRSSSTKLNRTIPQNAEQERALLENQMEMLLYYLNKMPVQLFQLSSVESDDVISFLATSYFSESDKIYIVSSDKDFMQLLTHDNIKLISPVKSKGMYPVYDTREVVKKYGVHPNNLVLARSFEGDLSDNIKGVKGIGISTLLKYIPELKESKEYDVNYIIDKSKLLLEENKKSKQLMNIVSSKDIIERNVELMDLTSTAGFSMSNVTAVQSIMEDYNGEKPNFTELRNMTVSHGLTNCIMQSRRTTFIDFLRPIFSLYNK